MLFMKANNLVMVFGTFDVLHPGHLWFLKKASQYGRVIVALTPDKMCLKYKGRLPCHGFTKRKSRLEDIIYLDKVISADTRTGSWQTVQQLRPATLVLGYDQKLLRRHLEKRLRELNLNPGIIMLKAYRQHFYQSSRLRTIAETV